MKTAFRSLAAIVAGLLLALLLLSAVELFGAVVHPVPEDFAGTTEEMCRHVERIPPWLLAVSVPLWGMTAFASTWTTQKIGNLGSAIFVGLLLLVGLVSNLWMLPYPIWFKIVNLIMIPAAILFGSRLSMRRNAVAIQPANGES